MNYSSGHIFHYTYCVIVHYDINCSLLEKQRIEFKLRNPIHNINSLLLDSLQYQHLPIPRFLQN